MRFILASANTDKAAEIAEIMADERGIELIARPPEVPDVDETEDTLVGNALLKARALVAATGIAAIADDTGLEVDALSGAPGVYSARYAGEPSDAAANRAKLLYELSTQLLGDRAARFRTVAVAVFPDGREVIANGVCEGVITPAERGAAGFGYDAIFVPLDGDGRTFAEMTSDEKHLISHRGRAFRELQTLL